MIEIIETRIQKRMTGETYDHDVMEELSQTILDRLCIRLGVNESTYPLSFYSICVDASVKAWRRRYYEGIASENVSNISDSFVEDILAEYDAEITAFKNDNSNGGGSGKVVRFL